MSHPHRLQAVGVAADVVHRDAGREFGIAIVEANSLGVHSHHHLGHVTGGERMAVLALGHVATGGERHLAVLQMESGVGELVEAADMVVVQMREHDGGR